MSETGEGRAPASTRKASREVHVNPAGQTALTLQRRLGHRFSQPGLLAEALTHRSALGGRTNGNTRGRSRSTPAVKGAGSNERLEFVGDRVLGLLMAEWLFQRFPDEQEGALGARHAHLVSRPVLAEIAAELDLAAALKIARHEEVAGIRELASVRADAMEAVLGALYLDAGLEAARKVIHELWESRIENAGKPHKEPKTLLQEYLLGRGEPLPHYELLSSTGPSHAPLFHVEARGCGMTGTGEAGSKRAAESLAATDLLRQLTGSGSGAQTGPASSAS
ncbi:ribonuclease III [Oecophyllibacter saccharovorans]|uniref:ribonuclease III n=1 Tax=Oecophyllibacter saccharovorans TaxID=2558360 RepID=UPI0011723A75|nr:ribonuclease III [Oecophyllibacter saccharovorans]TPW36676.1 ribonuclease III [Oecophyllibacter saccharovorans]